MPATRSMDGDAWLAQDVEILIPAALENQVTGDNVERIHRSVRIVAEGANGPPPPRPTRCSSSAGIFVIPDFLANAGGVTCSYFEQVQCNTNFFWPKDEVLQRLDQKMTSAFHAVADLAERDRRVHARRGVHDRHPAGRDGVPPARLGVSGTRSQFESEVHIFWPGFAAAKPGQKI